MWQQKNNTKKKSVFIVMYSTLPWTSFCTNQYGPIAAFLRKVNVWTPKQQNLQFEDLHWIHVASGFHHQWWWCAVASPAQVTLVKDVLISLLLVHFVSWSPVNRHLQQEARHASLHPQASSSCCGSSPSGPVPTKSRDSPNCLDIKRKLSDLKDWNWSHQLKTLASRLFCC